MYRMLACSLRTYARLLSAGLLIVGLSFNAALAQQSDEPLQQQLDEYIALSLANNIEAANALLNDLYQQYYLVQDANSSLAAKVRLMSYQLTSLLYAKQQLQADTLLSELLALTEATETPDVLAEIYATEIEYLMYKQELSAAIIKADRLELNAEQTTTPRIRYYAHNLLGRLFKADDQYERALQHFTEALDAVITTDDQFTLRRRSFLNYQIALVYSALKKWPEAKVLTEELIADAKKYQYKQFLPDLYLMLGVIVAEQKDYQQAITINQLGLAAAQENNQPGAELTFQNNLGSIYMEQGNFTAAEKVLQSAAKQAKALDDEYSSQLIAFNLAFIDVNKGQHESGLENMRAAIAYFEKNDTKAQFESTLPWLAKAYAVAGKYQLQAQTLQQQLQLREEILTSER
ncbi:tetratricopeptide repeat protein, partial [Arsukibacterium sp.]|uniref:tetratricopeptide repeat protein n=1 Tax=Arsukibacterium sp. TaxID=1977258 RepID=UPI003568ECDB